MVSTRTMSNGSEGGDNASSSTLVQVQGFARHCTGKPSRFSTEKVQDSHPLGKFGEKVQNPYVLEKFGERVQNPYLPEKSGEKVQDHPPGKFGEKVQNPYVPEKSGEKVQDPQVPEKFGINLQYLPTEIFENIASYLPHRTIGQMRLVSRKMDSLCSGILNFKFQRLQTLMLTRFQSIKAKMPRRESARRNHPLACEADIIETLHMRLTLLQMTFGKHIERKHCCFFAGEILDECYRIIHYIRVTQKLSRPYKVTDELFDLSTMAMEYFKEHIEPTLPEIAYFTSSDFLEFVPDRKPPPFTMPVTSYDEPSTPLSAIPNKMIKKSESACGHDGIAFRNNLRCMKTGIKRQNNHIMMMRRELRNSKSKILEQQKQILDHSKRLDESEKKIEDNSRKFNIFLQELNKCKTELQFWRTKSLSVSPNCDGCGKAFGVSNEAELVKQGLLPEGWADFINLAPVAIINKRDDVLGEPLPIQNVVKKPEEVKAGESKAIPAKDAKVPAGKEVKSALCVKRKIEDEDVKAVVSGTKPKDVKAAIGTKKAKLGALKEKAADHSAKQTEGSSGRRILKPRAKQGKVDWKL